jgi:hypothetical protein
VTDEGLIILEPQQILDTRWFKQGNKFEEESLIQWQRLPVEEATWEPTKSLLEQFPHINLKDKVPLGGGRYC